MSFLIGDLLKAVKYDLPSLNKTTQGFWVKKNPPSPAGRCRKVVGNVH